MKAFTHRFGGAALGILAALALGITHIGCSPAYVEFLIDASSCDFGKVYEVIYEFKDNPTGDPMNGPMIVRGGQRRTVSMWPPGTWSRERVDVQVYELPAAPSTPPAPTASNAVGKRLVRMEVVTVDINQPPPVLTVCAAP